LYALLKHRLKVDLPDDAIAKEIARRRADAHGLTLMPFFAGERSTGYHEDAAGSIVGLRPAHDSIDILQAAMESITFRFAEILDQIKTLVPVRKLVVSGGALEASAVWRQIVADVLGQNIEVFKGDEASMRGAVLLALESLGKIGNIQRVSTETERTKFHPKCHKIYKAARKRHREHYELLIQKNEHSSKNG
jgi:gluconokinase